MGKVNKILFFSPDEFVRETYAEATQYRKGNALVLIFGYAKWIINACLNMDITHVILHRAPQWARRIFRAAMLHRRNIALEEVGADQKRVVNPLKSRAKWCAVGNTTEKQSLIIDSLSKGRSSEVAARDAGVTQEAVRVTRHRRKDEIEEVIAVARLLDKARKDRGVDSGRV